MTSAGTPSDWSARAIVDGQPRLAGRRCAGDDEERRDRRFDVSLDHAATVSRLAGTVPGGARAHHIGVRARLNRTLDPPSCRPWWRPTTPWWIGPLGSRSGRELVGRVRDRVEAWVNDPGLALPALLLLSFVLRAAWIDKPPGGLIFDEAYYVNASRVVLGLPVAEDAHYAGSPAGLDPNIEHPPLGKVLIAGSMAIFGDGPLGWRLPSIIAALIAIAAVYLIVRASGETAALAFGIAGFVAFDNLTFVHGRIATLDMLVLAPILVAAWLALRERWLLAGVLVGLGFLVKLSALYGLLAIGALLAMRAIGNWRRERRVPMADARAAVLLVAGVAVVGLVGLWLLDLRFTTFTSPLDHVRHMVEYGASLKEPDFAPGSVRGRRAHPWQWLINDCKINYLSVDSIVRDGETIVARITAVEFRGAMNPLLVASPAARAPGLAGDRLANRQPAGDLGDRMGCCELAPLRAPRAGQPPRDLHLLLPAGRAGRRLRPRSASVAERAAALDRRGVRRCLRGRVPRVLPVPAGAVAVDPPGIKTPGPPDGNPGGMAAFTASSSWSR